MKASSFRSTRAWPFLIATVMVSNQSWGAQATPYIPRDDAEILERVAASRDPLTPILRDLHGRLAVAPNDLALATDLARRYVELNRAEGDPRYLGRAEAVLAPWWDNTRPPIDALVLRAIVKQSQHDFHGALRDLKMAVDVAPANAQAWLTRATVFTVLGEYDQARGCCLALARVAPELVAVTAAASIAALTGQGETSCRAIEAALGRNSSAPVAQTVWALTVCAETYGRLGRTSEAEACFRQGMDVAGRDPYLLGAFADFLLDAGRGREAAQILQGDTRVDGLLLRLALAESTLRPIPVSLAQHKSMLQERLVEAGRRGDSAHRREEARFALHLRHQPGEALRLARENWSVQHEPADVRIFLEAALAAGRQESAEPVIQFVVRSGLEDIQIQRLCQRFPKDK